MIKLSLPASEMRAFRKWTERTTAEERVKLQNLVARSGELITRSSKIAAPVSKKVGAGGRLRSSISPAYSSDRLTYNVVVNVNYAPFMEFGTGKFVRILPGYADIAVQFRGSGIRKVNLKSHPFLYDNFERVNKAFLKELNKMGFHERSVR